MRVDERGDGGGVHPLHWKVGGDGKAGAGLPRTLGRDAAVMMPVTVTSRLTRSDCEGVGSMVHNGTYCPASDVYNVSMD